MKEEERTYKEWASICRIFNTKEPQIYRFSELISFAEYYHKAKVESISDEEMEYIYEKFCDWYKDDGSYDEQIRDLLKKEIEKLFND